MFDISQDERRDAEGLALDTGVDFLVKARVARADIQMLVKLVEGLGHLGVVTTTDKVNGEVLIQTTKDCWPDLELALKRMPFQLEFLS